MERIIIDTDCGVDDAIALVYALRHPNAKVEAITCVAGNTSLHNVVNNVSKILHLCGKDDVPIYAGCDNPMARKNIFASEYHGKDGLGNASHKYPNGPNVQSEHATSAICRLAHQNKNEISLIVIGPCTNIAMAQRIDNTMTKDLKRIVCLGGNVEGRGNVTPGGEFNFASDPEAAHVMVSESECPLIVVPWEAIKLNWIPWAHYEEMTNCKTKFSQFFKDICEYSLPYYDSQDVEHDGYELGDFFAILTVLEPEAIKTKISRRVAVETKGEYTSGQLVQAWFDEMLPEVTKHTTIITKFDADMVHKAMQRMTA